MEAIHEYEELASFRSSLYSTAGGISQRTKELFVSCKGCHAQFLAKLFLCYFTVRSQMVTWIDILDIPILHLQSDLNYDPNTPGGH